MKKSIIIVLVISMCFALSSCSYIKGLFNTKDNDAISEEQIKNNKINAIELSLEEYNNEYENGNIEEKIVSIFSTSYLFNADEIIKTMDANSSEITILVNTPDGDKFNFNKIGKIDFDAFNEYIYQFEQGAFNDVWDYVDDELNYTIENQIRVTIEEKDAREGTYEATLDLEDLAKIESYYEGIVGKKYLEHVYSSDRVTAFYLETLKSLKDEDLTAIYNEANSEAQITAESKQKLFNEFAKVCLNNMNIKSVLYDGNAENTPDFINTEIVSLTYSNIKGIEIFKNGFASLFSTYIQNKQEPVESDVIETDLTSELAKASYESAEFTEDKIIEFPFQKSLTELTFDETFVKALVNNIYEEFKAYDETYESQYKLLEGEYFYKTRVIDATTVFIKPDANYRELEVVVSDEADCFIKVYAYDTENQTETKIVFSAYVKKGDTIVTNVPEGDYVFKYATGETWYGDIYMFSDEGQYSKSSQVISVHQPDFKTTITLKKVEDGNFGTFEESREDF